MSQAKVDRYKQEKANRKQIMKKEKMERLVWKIGGSLVCLVLVGWIGFSVYDKYNVPEVKNYEITTDAITNYLSDVVGNDDAE